MPLRDYQQEAVDSLFSFFRENRGEKGANPLVVAPTGSGKSHIIAGFIEQTLESWPEVRFLVCAHRKELIQQNVSKLKLGIHVGVYSAGLKQKEIGQVTFATIGSIYKKAKELAGVKVLIIDEAHLVPRSGAGMYRTLINELGNVRVVGLTATPYRLDCGHLVNDKDEQNIFSKVVYNTDMVRLIEKGLLSPVVTKLAAEHADTSKLHTRRGEFIAAETEDMFLNIIDAQCEEIMRFGEERKSWLIFCSGVQHSEKVTETLRRNGVNAESLTGNNSKADRGAIIDRFKRGETRCLCNCDILTTGFDAPSVDLLALLRPTQSTGLYVQMVGRGMRTAEGKQDCLLLDFGENVERHGPIDCVTPSRLKQDEKNVFRVCKACRGMNALTAEECEQCGAPFLKTCRECQVQVPLKQAKTLECCPECGCLWKASRDPGAVKAGELEALSYKRADRLEWYDVEDVYYKVHTKEDKPPSLKVTYYVKIASKVVEMNKFVCLQHGGWATEKAIRWVYEACLADRRKEMTDVNTVEELYGRVDCLKTPTRIRAKKDGRWWDITRFEYPKDEEWTPKKDWWEEEEEDDAEGEWGRFISSI